jgi:Flp pilus assembly protein TadD
LRHEDNELREFEISVDDFDLNLLPPDARSPGTPKFESAIKHFYEQELKRLTDVCAVSVDEKTIRVTWRDSATHPDPVSEAASLLQSGDYTSGIQILKLVLPSRESDPAVHYNLGMAYSDIGKLGEAVEHLTRATQLDKRMVNARVALGVAYARQKNYEAAAATLKEAVLEDPDNGFALRNLGAILMQLGRDQDDAHRYLRRSAELMPDDQQAWLGLAQVQMADEDFEDADESLIRCINIQPFSQFAEIAKEMRSRIAQQNFRAKAVGSTRPDAVMYCLGALRKLGKMPPAQVRNIGFEIATLGMNGIDVNDHTQKYTLRTLPGSFSGLHLLCYQYVAFKQFAPEMDIGFDLANEYREAKRMSEIGL